MKEGLFLGLVFGLIVIMIENDDLFNDFESSLINPSLDLSLYDQPFDLKTEEHSTGRENTT